VYSDCWKTCWNNLFQWCFQLSWNKEFHLKHKGKRWNSLFQDSWKYRRNKSFQHVFQQEYTLSLSLWLGFWQLGLDTGWPVGTRVPTRTWTHNFRTRYGSVQNPYGSTRGFGNPCTGPLLFECWNCVLERKKCVWMGDTASVKAPIQLYENVAEVKPNVAANLSIIWKRWNQSCAQCKICSHWQIVT
jgi:hypothetical protein